MSWLNLSCERRDYLQLWHAKAQPKFMIERREPTKKSEKHREILYDSLLHTLRVFDSYKLISSNGGAFRRKIALKARLHFAIYTRVTSTYSVYGISNRYWYSLAVALSLSLSHSWKLNFIFELNLFAPRGKYTFIYNHNNKSILRPMYTHRHIYIIYCTIYIVLRYS